ncbi:MAG TPA: glutamate racemase [Firmicutes bacterium]|nr:glutamate racemase [Candidatus Fermentithermobacillaceae bacterium]
MEKRVLEPRYAPVGVLDSGVGGLTVVRKMKEILPYESILYFGDTGRLPYGPRPLSEVRRFVSEIVDFLSGMGAKAIVIACNTATAAALDLIEKSFKGPVVGVIGPGARAALKAAGGRSGRVGLIATQGTVDSGAYDMELERLGLDLPPVKKACPELVLLAERGLQDENEVRSTIRRLLGVFHTEKVDCLILGCTHFPLLSQYIREELPGIKLVDPAEEAVLELKEKLSRRDLLADELAAPRYLFYTSGDEVAFRKNLGVILGKGDYSVQKVSFQDDSSG